MRVVMFLVVLTGCGRFGFGEHDPSGDGGSGDDAAIDGESPLGMPQFCDDRVVTTLSIEPLASVAIRAVALSSGYAVAVETTSLDIPLLELDTSANLVATHAPFTPLYAPLYGISQHEGRPVVHLQTDSESYIKLVDPGWDAYTTGPSGDPSMIDPAYVELSADTGIAGLISGGAFEIGILDDNEVAAIAASDYTPTTAISGSIVPTTSGARVVVEKAGGVCETFVVTSSNMTKALHTFSPCYAPKAAAIDDTTAVIVHRIDAVGPYAVHVVPAVETDAGTTYPLSGATYARVAAREDGAIWVGHVSGSYRALMRFAGGTMTEYREQVPGRFFDLTERDAFWIDGSTVHVSTPCLR